MKNAGALIIKSQPPHLGEFLLVVTQLMKYDFLYICLNFKEPLMPIPQVLALWTRLLAPYKKKTELMLIQDNFATVAKEKLPEHLKDVTYLTTDRTVFVHLSTMNVPTELIPRVLGYHGIFIRTAYRQSKALDWLESRFVNSANSDNKINK